MSGLSYLRVAFFFPAWLIAVYGNYSCHVMLRELKIAVKKRPIVNDSTIFAADISDQRIKH